MQSTTTRITWSDLKRDQSPTALIAAIIAILAGYGGPLAIVIQTAQTGQLSSELTTSMLWALCVTFGLAGFVLSFWTRAPIITAWSTPGAAFLITALQGVPYEQAIAAFVIASLVIFLIAISGAFDVVMNKIPKTIAAALLAGILFNFGIKTFAELSGHTALMLTMLATYLIGKRFFARYAVLAVLIVGCVYVFGVVGADVPRVSLDLAVPVFTMPEFTWTAVLNIGLPLALVTLTGQQMTGIAVLRASGYNAEQTPAKPLVALTSFLSLITAPFGNFGINLAAITAAICTEKESHPDPARRYISGLWCGVFSIILGSFAGVLVLFFLGLPTELITVLAGLALLGAIMNGLTNAMSAQHSVPEREAALITFMTCVSGVKLFNIGSAFWGIVLGCTAYMILTQFKKVK
ncbi:transporter [Formosimonas limnophila]|uniref:Transporter n=1 Tax=Formosimonas limnophila TaxID=1384487 RepID=A0A8J3CMU4_9BURK|nr:benzoate/H(+) symporter BenE family transporter [Formosimonas limnophila]GHA68970.1 transporter [Formosimonas limnophila]